MKKLFLGIIMLFLATTGVVNAGTVELPATGQVTCYDNRGAQIACAGTGQDGDKQAGAALPVPRFTPNYLGLTVVDNLTGLMWTLDSRTPDPYDPNVPVCAPDYRLMPWQEPPPYNALDYIDCLNTHNFLGYNDWRLPNRWELRSLTVDASVFGPALPPGHPFINAENGWHYWSSTSCTSYLISDAYPGHDVLLPWEGAWVVNMWDASEYI